MVHVVSLKIIIDTRPEGGGVNCLERPEAPGCNDWNPGGGYSDDETNPHY